VLSDTNDLSTYIDVLSHKILPASFIHVITYIFICIVHRNFYTSYKLKFFMCIIYHNCKID
jgi:ABC-type multidrug transport system permease subunit